MVQPVFTDSRGIAVRVFNAETNPGSIDLSSVFSLGSAFYFTAPDTTSQYEFDGALNMRLTDSEFRRVDGVPTYFDTESIYRIPSEFQNLFIPFRLSIIFSEAVNLEAWVIVPIDPCVIENNENQDIMEFIISLVATGVTGAAQVLIPNPLGALLATQVIRGVSTRILNQTTGRRSFRVFNPSTSPVALQFQGGNQYTLPPNETYVNDDWTGSVNAAYLLGGSDEIDLQVFEYVAAPA